MNNLPCLQRSFPFKLASWLPARYATTLHWLKSLLERLGHAAALAAWQEAQQNADDVILRQILQTGWHEVAPDEAIDVEGRIAGLFTATFPAAIEGVSPQQARELVELMPPIHQVRQTFPVLNVWKETTTCEALHLSFDGIACLAEVLIRVHGKQGELIAYDVHRERRIQAGGGITGSVAEFIADFIAEPEEANLFSAGLETALVSYSAREVVLHVKECAWARYFQERHPQVGYLMACSTDEAAYRAFNTHLRMQRTTTLMEGGTVCDFRIYAVGEAQHPETTGRVH